MRRVSLIEYFDLSRQWGRETAFVQRRGYRRIRWSYDQVARSAFQFARELEARRIGPRDRILLWGENSAEWVAAFWGCVLRGVVAVPMDRVASPEFAARVARQVEAKLQVCSRDAPGVAGGAPVFLLEDFLAGLRTYPADPYPPCASECDDPVEIVFTSGTTAEPRGVVLTHGNLLANLDPFETEIRKYRRYERIFHPLRFLNLLPLSHIFGQMLGIFIPQLLGATVIFLDTLRPAEIVRAIRKERVSVLVAVPRLLESLEDKVRRDLEAAGRLARIEQAFRAAEGEHFLRRWWRFRDIHRQFGWKFWALISGGAALPAETEQFWSRVGYAVIQGYGLTETTSLVSVNHPLRLGKGSIGKALPGLEIRLDENGEILVRGENIAAGYWQEQKLEPVAGRDGWFRTGDLGERDAEGNLYFRGRRKNVIVTPAGMNIYPEDLEAALRAQSGVRDAVVVGLERDGNAEPCAVLLLREPTPDPGTVVREANRSLAEYQKMRRWLVWRDRDFPRTPTEKPLLPRIREVVEAEFGKAPPAGASPSPLAELISRISRQPVGQLMPQARLAADLELGSIDRVELLSALEERYQVDLDEAGFTDATTVGELEELLRKPAPTLAKFAYPRWPQRWPVTWIREAAFYLLTAPAMIVLGWPRVSGRKNLRGVRGPAIVISNHVTPIDAGFVLAALPARLRRRLAVAMGGERLRAMRHPSSDLNVFARLYLRLQYVLVVALFNVFPLPKQAGYRESFSFAGELADRGWSVLIFPEGGLTEDGKLQSFRSGIGLLATRLGLPVIPLRIEGLFELRQARKKMAPPGRIRIFVGAPVSFRAEADPAGATKELERRVAALGSAQS